MAIRRWVMGAGGLLMLGAAAWELGSGSGSAPRWRRHQDPMGFSVELPSSWALRSDPATGRVEGSGTEGERWVVWPLFVPGSTEAPPTGAFLVRMASQLWPEARWEAPEPLEGRAWRVRGTQGERRGICLLTWVGTPRGASGFLYLASAPRGRARDAEPLFARVLDSFRLGGPEAPAGPRAPVYVPWTDPKEGAFSVEVPEGWQVQGGSSRPSTLLVQSQLQAAAPNGQAALWVGDAFPIFVEPNPMLAFAGIRAGGTYLDPTGYVHPVGPYLPGVEYLVRTLLPQRLGGSLRLVSRQDRPDLARRLVSLGINRFDAGAVEYRFQRGGRDWRGWALCVTERVVMPAVSHWHVWRLCQVEALPERFEEAASALEHLVSSFRIDPGWAQRQANLTAAQSRIIADMGAATSRTILETGQFRSKVMDEIDRRGANARRGVEEVVDPLTGRQTTVTSGSNYYWVDPRGTVLGTTTDTHPGLNFRALTRLP